MKVGANRRKKVEQKRRTTKLEALVSDGVGLNGSERENSDGKL